MDTSSSDDDWEDTSEVIERINNENEEFYHNEDENGDEDEELFIRLLEPPRGEMQLMNRVLELEGEELVEEDDDEDDSGDDSQNERRGDGGAGPHGGFTFDPSVTSLHSYLGEFDDVNRGPAGQTREGTPLEIPLFYLEGIVLFPDQTLPLRVRQPRFISGVQEAMKSTTAPGIIGVVNVGAFSTENESRAASVGTTAQVQQMRTFPDGSLSILTQGAQRFTVKRVWNDGSPMALVHIIEEPPPLPLPRSAFSHLSSRGSSNSKPSLLHCSVQSPSPPPVSLTHIPHWAYRMFDAFELAARVSAKVETILRVPVPASLPSSPVALSWFASRNLPLCDSARQKLLELDRVDCRLTAVFRLLDQVDRIRCSTCNSTVAKRADLMSMSTEGAIGTFTNTYGIVHDTVTLRKTTGLVLQGAPQTRDSWFPGYAWTIAYCGSCGAHMGWRFNARRRGLKPKVFWGVRRPQITTRSQI